MKGSTLIKVWVVLCSLVILVGLIGLAQAQSFDDRWTSGTAPVLTTPNVVTIAPQIAVNPQITITPQITVNPPIVTMGKPQTAPVPPVAKPQMLVPVPQPRVSPRIIVRRYYDDYPMTDLSVPADRVLRSDRPGCNGIACYP